MKRPISYPQWIALPPITWPLGEALLPSDQLVLAIFVDRWRNGSDVTQIGPALLAAMTGYSPDTIERAIDRLIKLDLLERVHGGGASRGTKRSAASYALGRLTQQRIERDGEAATAKAASKKSRRATGGTMPPIGSDQATAENATDRGHHAPHRDAASEGRTGGTVPPVVETDRGHRPGARTGGTMPPRSYKRGDAETPSSAAPGSVPGDLVGAEVPEVASTPLADASGSGSVERIKPPLFGFADEKREWLRTPKGIAYLAQQRALKAATSRDDDERVIAEHEHAIAEHAKRWTPDELAANLIVEARTKIGGTPARWRRALEQLDTHPPKVRVDALTALIDAADDPRIETPDGPERVLDIVDALRPAKVVPITSARRHA